VCATVRVDDEEVHGVRADIEHPESHGVTVEDARSRDDVVCPGDRCAAAVGDRQ
jgi:hypothetical protein